MQTTPKNVLDDLITLLTSYSSVYRGSYLPSRTTQYEAEPGSNILRESVAEHVGLLPITASFLHPYLEQEVNLGTSLTMLAIHDIGETQTGDIMTVTRDKTDEELSNEEHAALVLLHDNFDDMYCEFDANKTREAKFANAIDKITPNTYELIIDPEIARTRHAHFGFNIVTAVEKDVNLMQWDRFLEELYGELLGRVKERFE